MPGSVQCETDLDKREDWVRCVLRGYTQRGYGEQLREILKLAWPITLSTVLEQFVYMLTAMFAGHLGKNQLDAMALGNTSVNITSWSLAIGLNTACDTLFPQTYGSKNRKHLGILLQKALVINLLLIIPCSAVLLNMDCILIWSGQDPLIARMAGKYTAMNIPGILGSALMLVLIKYLACQQIVTPTVLILTVMNILHVLFLQTFMYWFKLDMAGAAMAMNVTYIAGAIMHMIYIYGFRIYTATWTGWSITCLLEWREFMRLSLYGTLMICLSWWSLELYMVLTGLLGTVELAAHYVAIQIISIMEMLAYGLGSAITVRVGNLVGQGDHVTAKAASHAGMIITFVGCLTTSSLFFLFGHFLPAAFTNDREVEVFVTRLVPLMTSYMILDSLRSSAGAILRGVGRQRFGAVSAFVCTYGLAMPLGIYLMFTSLGLFGVWTGICVSELLRGVCFCGKILKLNWKQEAQLAESRTDFKFKRIPNTNPKEYQQIPQEDSPDNESEADTIPSMKDSDGHHITPSLKKTLLLRTLTFCVVLMILILGICVHFMNIYEGISAGNSNITSPVGE